ncbi:DUF1028 domain-containing protein [candidate division TA06 bacterium]|nr:DUF1028 domain-containing protein [candidate division TA06 bacterium]
MENSVGQRVILLSLLIIIPFHAPQTLAEKIPQPIPSTFSIVAIDPENGDLGIAVQSKFFGVGVVVPWAKAGVGAVATQAFANTSYGPRGLALLEEGLSAEEVLKKLIDEDEGRDQRQLGIVGTRGTISAYTGSKCNEWAGDHQGKTYTAQGNILTGEEVVKAMGEAFEETTGELAERLVVPGGDRRGKQSAALLVVRKQGGYGGFDDRYIDLRVDDHPEPIQELIRLLGIKLTQNHIFKASAYSREKKYEEAIEEVKWAVKSNPGNGSYHYDLACFYSLAGKKSMALKSLEKAFDLDPRLRSYSETDSDLDNVRGEKGFKRLMEAGK